MSKSVVAFMALVNTTLAAGAFAAGSVEVRLRSSVGCSGSVVRLADVAEVISDDGRIAAALAEIPLCPAPAAGSQRSLSQHDVRQLLALSGVEAKAANVTGSDSVAIAGEAAGASIVARRPLVATGVRQAVFEAEAEAGRQQPVARLTAKSAVAPLTDDKEPAPPKLVERNAVVTVHARAASIKVTTSGKALEAGAAGETIRVELSDSKERVLARVIGPQEVEVAANDGAPGPQSPARPAAVAAPVSR